MRKRTMAALVPIASMGAWVAGLLADPPPGYLNEVVVAGLVQPIALDFLPDGRMLILQKGGAMLIADPQANPVAATPYMTLPQVATRNNLGLLSITLDPDFAGNGRFYLYYAHAAPERLRLSRFTHLGDTGDLVSELVIWQNESEIHYPAHLGGGLDFGPDGRLYLTTGDEFDENQPQDLTDAGGKVIRINPDGSIPLNPFSDGPGGNLDEIWAYGLRNPFRAAWDLPSGRLFIGEVGGNNQATAWEDLHLGQAGVNFGWPYCEGPCDNGAFPDCSCGEHDDPVFTYPHLGEGASIIAGVVYRGDTFPAHLVGAYFYADHTRDYIRYLTFDAGGNVTGDQEFDNTAEKVVAIKEGPDGALYYAGLYEGAIRRIVFVPGDLDGDGTVGIVDFLTLLGQWGPCPAPCPPSCPADLDGDCEVGITDFLGLLGNWG